jgi:integrase
MKRATASLTFFTTILRIAQHDYSPDKYRERFPKFDGAESGITPWELFDKWITEREPAPGTVESWRYVFAAMRDYFRDRSAASIMEAEAQAWIDSLKSAARSARTVANTYITASRTVFKWARDHKHIPRNPFADAKITVPKKKQLRETRAFRPQEYKIILKAALEITNPKTPYNAARRWVPWLCAYTGARVGEITQLRASDVIKRDGIRAILITPDAGTVKSGRARVVPLHAHLIAQEFLKFVEGYGHGKGPLFYKPTAKDTGSGTKQTKPRSAQMRQRLAAWVRTLGITDTELQPNHAWRHTFKQIADRVDISERTSNYITGHAHKNVGATYGAPTLGGLHPVWLTPA